MLTDYIIIHRFWDNKIRFYRMQVFRPFRATVQRQQKYYSERRVKQKSASIFNLPRQVITEQSSIVTNFFPFHGKTQNLRSISQQSKTFVSQNKNHAQKTAKRQTDDLLNKKVLEKVKKALMNVPKKRDFSEQKINRNKSMNSTNQKKEMPFETLDILYRTIMKTNGKKKSPIKFEVSARKLPILQKDVPRPKSQKKSFQAYIHHSSLDHYRKLHSGRLQSALEQRMKFNRSEQIRVKQNQFFQSSNKNEKDHISSLRRRLEGLRDKAVNQIMPWTEYGEMEQQDVLYPAHEIVGYNMSKE